MAFSWSGFWTRSAFDAHEVHDGIFLGSFDAAAAELSEFEKRNIGFVLSIGADLPPKVRVRAARPLPGPKALNVASQHPHTLTYLTCECEDESMTNLLPNFELFHEFIDHALSKKRSVLVHCQAGISRSTTCVVSYLMRRHGMTFYDALCKVRSKRSFVSPNTGFTAQLEALDEFLRAGERQGEGDVDALEEYRAFMQKAAPDVVLLLRNKPHPLKRGERFPLELLPHSAVDASAAASSVDAKRRDLQDAAAEAAAASAAANDDDMQSASE